MAIRSLIKGILLKLASGLQKAGQAILNRFRSHPPPTDARTLIFQQPGLFLELLPDIAFVLDLNGKVIYSNARMTGFLGMDWKSLKGLDIRDFVVPEYQEKAEKALETTFQQGEIRDTHLVIKDILDRRVHVLISAKLIQDATGKDISYVGNCSEDLSKFFFHLHYLGYIPGNTHYADIHPRRILDKLSTDQYMNYSI